MSNVDFKFDFKSALAKAYQDDAVYQKISYIAKGIDMKCISTEQAIRNLIEINSLALSKVLEAYTSELLNEL